ncbi:serine/threonine-protein kinase [Actinomadura miaoliensis]|uniref:non-specific serine/threonine protein kinase n=1 Tax=Actinomadura miaoliensis TaxID=430685 RepID=A0ABP7WN44_9ACTN
MTAPRVLAGRYRLVERLGQGAMGVVWRGRDEALGREVAVKELLLPAHLDAADREHAARRAFREARAAAALDHESIVTVHDVVMDGDRPCIVMDLLPGRSLDAVLADRGALPPVQAARVGLDVVRALRAAHERGVQHRDVKPANIFLRDDGRAVLTDFGIAALEGDATLTQEGSLIGSPAYMAPERVRHERGGPESDLWSLGATLYALVEGRPPFARSTLMGTLSAVLTQEPVPPSAAGPLTPVIMRLLVKDPAARLPAGDAENALLAVASGKEAPPPPPPGFSPVPPSPPVPRASTVPPGSTVPPVTTVPPVPTMPPRRPPSGRGRGVVVPLVTGAVVTLVAVVAVVAVVLSTRGDGNPPSGPASPGRTGTAAASGPVRFAKPPPACGLITADQAARLVPAFSSHADASDDYSTGLPKSECRWSVADPGARGEPELGVTLIADRATAAAQTRFQKERRTAAPLRTPDPERPFRDIPGLGDEAYGSDRLSDDARATVVFRLGNLTAEIEYQADGRAIGSLRENALQAARWVEAALKRQG